MICEALHLRKGLMQSNVLEVHLCVRQSIKAPVLNQLCIQATFPSMLDLQQSNSWENSTSLNRAWSGTSILSDCHSSPFHQQDRSDQTRQTSSKKMPQRFAATGCVLETSAVTLTLWECAAALDHPSRPFLFRNSRAPQPPKARTTLKSPKRSITATLGLFTPCIASDTS